MQIEEYETAEQILHLALQSAQDLAFEAAVVYVLDVLANIYFKKEDYKRAEMLFSDLFNRILPKVEPNDESLIEMSIKLSHIYSISGDFEKCKLGFDYCLTEQRKRVKPFIEKDFEDLNKEEINSLALLGMSYDYYGKHLSSVGKFDDAIYSYNNALDICRKINGETHPQTLVLMNDISATYVHKEDYENALIYLKKTIESANKTQDKNLANFYYNMGSVYLLQFNKKLALNSCKLSLSLAIDSKDKSVEKMARKCLKEANIT